jgi:very-short-patch-repair endonuclease
LASILPSSRHVSGSAFNKANFSAKSFADESSGLRVLRFENKLIFENLDAVLEAIKAGIMNKPPVND